MGLHKGKQACRALHPRLTDWLRLGHARDLAERAAARQTTREGDADIRGTCARTADGWDPSHGAGEVVIEEEMTISSI